MRASRRAPGPVDSVAVICACLATATAGCHRGPRRETVSEALQPDYDKTSVAVVGEQVAPPAPRCTVTPVRLGAPGTTLPPLEGVGVYGVEAPAGGAWLAGLDRAASVAVFAPPDGAPIRFPLARADDEPPALVAFARDHAVALMLAQRGATRAHRLVALRAPATAREIFSQPERADETLATTLVATRDGVLIAWGEPRSPSLDSVIQAQFVPRAALDAGDPIAPPAIVSLTPVGDDADEPELIAMPDGSAVLMYLTAQDVDSDAEANATASDIWLRAVSPLGTPVGEPVKITPGPANRFGAVALANAGAVWVAYRVAGDSDQESQGDGGLVAVVRVGADLHPTASPAYLSANDAQPTGEPSIVRDGAGVTVFWGERRGEDVRTMRRRVEPDGRVVRAALDEPALNGQLPAGGERASSRVLWPGAHGQPGIARVLCPDVPEHAH